MLTIAQLRKDVLQIKTSPVYDFLDQLTNTDMEANLYL